MNFDFGKNQVKMADDADVACEGEPTKSLKMPLKSTKQIYLAFLVPALVHCIIFIGNFSADFAVAIQHFREGNPIWGGCTIAFMYLPAIVYFILTISRPDWWMTDDDKANKGVTLWFLLQLLQLIAFPFFALYRYAGQIVLSVDAILLSNEERKKTLNTAMAPAAVELYFFLQAWFQAAPQAVFQMHLLFRERAVTRSYQSEVVQIICVIISIIVMSKVTTSFQRYESQRINGRKLPWAMWFKKYKIQELQNLEEKQPLHSGIVNASAEKGLPRENQGTDNKESERRVILQRQISTTPPLPPKNAQVIPPPMPLRRITSITPIPVPDMPAPPRPDSIATEPETLENTDRLNSDNTTNLAAAAVATFNEPSNNVLRLPKRKLSAKGLEEDDPVGIILSFCWWFLFILARILSIAIFYEFYPLYLAGMLGIHYVLMIAYLFYNCKYFDVANFFVNLWLGLVYIFCIIEYRIKFKYADKWLLVYYTFVILQNTGLTLAWYFYADWDRYWFRYIFYAIFCCMVLCVVSTSVYYVMFKPRKRKIYVT